MNPKDYIKQIAEVACGQDTVGVVNATILLIDALASEVEPMDVEGWSEEDILADFTGTVNEALCSVVEALHENMGAWWLSEAAKEVLKRRI
jgi:hypothetical protein